MADKGVVFILLIGTLASILSSSQCQNCASQNECGLCVSTSGCAWCSQVTFAGIRCQPAENLTESPCPMDNVQNPSSSFVSSTPSDPTTNDPLNLEEVRLDLRVGDPVTFQVNVTALRNLPLDLYILIDLSASMNDELNTIQLVSSQLATQIEGITTNVHLGFGSFNDKVTLPFARETIDKQCPETPQDFCPSYAFRHTVTLTEDSDDFARQVRAVTLTSNVDRAENGLEGLAQVIACQNIIGWRPRMNGVGTRVVLFMTDEEFHFAGEGRLAGILTPYNGTCLLEPAPVPVNYTLFDEIDYPSVGQILNLLRMYDVTTIFAIQENHIDSYNVLSKLLNSDTSIRSIVAPFTVADNTNATMEILTLIEQQYRRILQGITLRAGDNDASNDIDFSVEFVPRCPPGSIPIDNGCDIVPLDETVTYDVTITLNSCAGLMHGDRIRQTIVAPAFGSFDIVYSTICNCDCALNPTGTPTSNCSGNGVALCGVCECNEGRCGSDCSKFIGDRISTDCPRGGVNNETCSGANRGTCDCTCNCIQQDGMMIFGEACQCDDFRCMPVDSQGRVCSGRGMCCEGNCLCDFNRLGRYRGDTGQINYCQCPPLEEVCMSSPNGTLCNGRGTCGCDFCMCSDPAYKGTFCNLPNVETCNFLDDETCINTCRNTFSTLPDQCSVCNVNRPLLFIDDADREDLNSAELRSRLESVTNERLSQTQGEKGAFLFLTDQCNYDVDGCSTEYYILGNETHFALVAVRELFCQPGGIRLPFAVWVLAPIIVGCLVVLGILILILIKIIFLLLDYVEVKRWQKDAQDADFSKNQNPLYQSPEMKYENVAYGRE